MRPLLAALLALAVAGCAGNNGPTSPDFSDCREASGDDIEASLEFAGEAFDFAWQRRCDTGGTRVFQAGAGEPGDARRLVTLTRYPPGAEARRTLEAYVARSARQRVGEPRVFRRGDDEGRPRYLAELMLRREEARELEYVLHGVTAGETGRVVSVTYTYRFQTADTAARERIQSQQNDWVRSLERLLTGFPPP